MSNNTPRGHTGHRVEEPGTYKCAGGETVTYVPGETFRECPNTGKPTVWEKTYEPDHPGGSR